MFLFLGIIPLIIGYFLLVPILAMFEKKLIKPYTENVDPELPESNQCKQFCKMLEEKGFVLRNNVKDSRGGTYKILFKFYRSPNGDAIAIVFSGTYMKMECEMTRIVTRFNDGTWIKSINKNYSEFDPTGLIREELFEKLSEQEFLAKHYERIEQETKSKYVIPYDEELPMIDYCGDLLRQCEILVSKGLARFRDEERTVWSYTFKGAVLVSFRTLVIGFRRADFKNQ